ncbi:MAG: hypothetical protein P8P30_02105 [Rickettsiales bacterium]|nr:hypothetical protein [Rickettsiales bacterium]
MPKYKHMGSTHHFKKQPTFMEKVEEFIGGCVIVAMVIGAIILFAG